MYEVKIYQDYLNHMARSLGTILNQSVDLRGMMYVEYEPPMIEGPLLEQPNTAKYPTLQCRVLSILHELGHVFHNHTQGRPPFGHKRYYFDHGVLKSECEAWNFALDRWGDAGLFPPLLSITREYMWKCLNSYYKRFLERSGRSHRLTNGNRHHVEFVFDTPDECFWETKKRILHEQ